MAETAGRRAPRAALLAGATAIATGLLAGTAMAASTYTVSGFEDTSPLPTCTGTVCPTLRSAIVKADGDPGSTIQLGGGTYHVGRGAGLPTAAGHLHIAAAGDVTLVGAGSGATTIQQTDGTHRVLLIDGTGTVTLAGLKITGGNLLGDDATTAGGYGDTAVGGGIDAGGAVALTLTDVSVFANHATGGAGAAISGGGFGGGGGLAVGGIYDFSSGLLTITNSTISANVATGGHGGAGNAGSNGGSGGSSWGGLSVTDGTVVMRSSHVDANNATAGRGATGTGAGKAGGVGGAGTGGLEITGSANTALITDSTISSNQAQSGNAGDGHTGADGGDTFGGFGGAFHSNVPLVMSGSTIAGNVSLTGTAGDGATGGNGGTLQGNVYLTWSDAHPPVGGADVIVNSTIVNNVVKGGAGGAPGGGTGGAIGGAIEASKSLTLVGDTLTGNQAITGSGGLGTGGNLNVSQTLTLSDTIVAGGVGSATTSNCNIHATVEVGPNLESTAPAQCKIGAPGDLIGVDPQLGPLAANGGLTLTEAPLPGSPVVGAGGACVDPSLPGSPALALDQRGLPRLAPCTLGAVEAQLPVNTAAPAISGLAAIGQALNCADGTWTADGALAFAEQWLRDGAPIAGAVGPAYTVQLEDAGHAISCQVTATATYGTRSALSTAVAVAAIPPVVIPTPVLSSVTQSATSWRLGSKLATISKAKPKPKPKPKPVGTTFTFKLNTAATVTLTFTHATSGRKVGSHCVASTKANRKHKACTRTLTDGTLSEKAKTGTNKLKFQGRLSSKKKLGLASYTVTFKAKGPTGKSSTSKTLHFKIVKS